MKRSVVLLAACLAALAGQTHAQQKSEAAAGSGGDDSDKNVIDTIYVTATKRLESVRDVPASIDAFSGERLEQQGITTLEDLVRFSPGVTFMSGDSPDSSQVNFRGAGSDRGAFNRPFGTFFEDVPLVNPTFWGVQPDVDTFDLQSVEIVKGPQGTLFGGSALIGAIRYVPNRPDYDKFGANAGYGFGTVSGSDDFNQEYTAMINVPFSDRIAMRFAGSVRDNAGIIDDTHNGIEDVNSYKTENWRVMVGLRPTDSLDIQLLHQDRRVQSDANVGTAIDNDRSRQVNAFLRDGRDEASSDVELSSAKFAWSISDDLTLSLISSRLKKDGRNWINEMFAVGPLGEEHDHYSNILRSTQDTHELRLVQDESTSGSWLLRDWSYVVGLFYMDADQTFDLQTFKIVADPSGPPALLLSIDARGEAEEKAFYFDAKRKLTSKLDLHLGVRVFEQETPLYLALKIFPGTRTFVPYSSLITFVETTDQVLKEDGVNPKAALTYHFNDDMSAFLSASRGFRFGGVNLDVFATGEPPDTFTSDYLWNYELGWRSMWLDNRLQIDATLFWVKWSDKQTSLITTAASEYIDNTGGRRMRGLEFTVRRAFDSGLSWMMNAAYVQSKTTEDYLSPQGVYTPAGAYERETPRWTGSTSLDYHSQIGAWDVDSSLAYSYRTHTEQRGVAIGSFGLADFYIGFQNSSWRFAPTIGLNVSNLLNEDELQFGGAGPPPPGQTEPRIRARTVVPRTVMLSAKFEF